MTKLDLKLIKFMEGFVESGRTEGVRGVEKEDIENTMFVSDLINF